MKKFLDYIILCLFCCTGLVACKNKIPSKVIQPSKMENILYDYHLAQAMGDEFSGGENYKKDLLIQYVFKKHRVTKAEFDSSMVWYTRNMDKLNDIYKNVKKRYDSADLSSFTYNSSAGRRMFPSGDTVNIWSAESFYVLTASDLTNRIVEQIRTDTTFHQLDRLLLEMHTIDLSKDTADMYAGLSIRYENDSTSSITQMFQGSGIHRLEINADTMLMKQIHCFVYLDDTIRANEVPSVVISHLSLTRYHAPDSELEQLKLQQAAQDSLDTDKEMADQIDRQELIKPEQDSVHRINRRLSPAEMRRQQEK